MQHSSASVFVEQATRPLVSVIIPTYNRAHLLARAIESVYFQEGIGQSFDLEAIVVDDCSSDNVADVVRRYPGTHYIRLPENRGASAARNVGIKAAKGKYIALLDDDDEFLTHKLLVQVPILESRSEIGAVYGQSVITNGNVLCGLWPKDAPSGRVFEEFVTRTDDFLHPPTWLIRRELFQTAGYFDETKAGMEHYDLALRIAFNAQWLFLAAGPVARGRFSHQGLWASTIADGTYERQIPSIIERALAMLPNTPDAEAVKRRARSAVCASIASHRWSDGRGVEPTRTHLIATLGAFHWMRRDPGVLRWLYRVAGAIANQSPTPQKAIKGLWREIVIATHTARLLHFLPNKQLLGALLREAAQYMRDYDSPRRAVLLAVNAVWHDPRQLVRSTERKCLCNIFLGAWGTSVQKTQRL